MTADKVGLQGKISVVIPCYNHGPMLLEALSSIERVRNDSLAEVIIVDDGSNDPETCRILQELDRTKYNMVHQQNGGLGAARNAGVEIARGEFILPLDSDNLIRRAYLDKGAVILATAPDVGVVYGDRELFGEEVGLVRVPGFDWRSMVRQNYIDACALFRRSVWESVGGYDEKMPRMGWEDWDFWMRAALQGWRFVHLDEIAFDYRVRATSMLSDTNQHQEELLRYMFGKSEYQVLRLLRDQSLPAAALSQILESWEYRVGSAIVTPLRKVKRLLRDRSRGVRPIG